MIGNYYFGDPEIHENLRPDHEKRGIIGWTGKVLAGRTPSGSEIHLGFEKNPHIPDNEQYGAQLELTKRARRIQSMLDQGVILKEDVPEVTAHLEDIQLQAQQHGDKNLAYRNVKTNKNPAMAKSMDSVTRLKKLRACLNKGCH
jgi:hypothetical protein